MKAYKRDEVFGQSNESSNKFAFGAMHLLRDAGLLIKKFLFKLFQDTEGANFVGMRKRAELASLAPLCRSADLALLQRTRWT